MNELIWENTSDNKTNPEIIRKQTLMAHERFWHLSYNANKKYIWVAETLPKSPQL